MLRKVIDYGLGQGCCCVCRITSGRHWSTDLFYILNKKNKYLCIDNLTGDYVFSAQDDDRYCRVAFCYKHALIVDEVRKTKTDYDK